MFEARARIGNEGSRLLGYYKQLKPPDCIQLACAGVASVEAFLTNDDRLAGIQVEGIQTVRGLSDWYREHVGSAPD